MYKFDIREINKMEALVMIRKYHYSNTLPKLNKHFIGFFLGNELVGVVTLGWGTRPRHTIQRIFPSLDTKDYLEIGRMCMTDEMPRNSESQMRSQLVKWMKINLPEIKVLFTWADGMLGKVGYVYQASNFIYPRCPNLTDGRFCEEHQKEENKRYEKYDRNPAVKRKYGRAWKRIRDSYAAVHPLCEECLKRGIYVKTEEIHHKLPLSEGGTHNRDNLVVLCKCCHAKIHASRGDRWHNKNSHSGE